jgi:hypothetical protein
LGWASNGSGSCAIRSIALIAAIATFALKAGVWFRRGRQFMVSPVSQAPPCPLSGRNSTYRLCKILEPLSFQMADARKSDAGWRWIKG